MRIIAMSSGEVSRCQCQRLFWYIRSTEKHAACAFDWQGMSLTSYECFIVTLALVGTAVVL